MAGTLLDQVHSFLHSILTSALWGGDYCYSQPLDPHFPHPQIQPTMGHKQYFPPATGNLQMRRAGGWHCSVPFSIEEFNVHGFWYLRRVWIQPPGTPRNTCIHILKMNKLRLRELKVTWARSQCCLWCKGSQSVCPKCSAQTITAALLAHGLRALEWVFPLCSSAAPCV